MSALAFLFHPQHALGMQEFVVTTTRDGKTTERTVWARSSIDAWDAEAELQGECLCRIQVEALSRRRANANLRTKR